MEKSNEEISVEIMRRTITILKSNRQNLQCPVYAKLIDDLEQKILALRAHLTQDHQLSFDLGHQGIKS